MLTQKNYMKLEFPARSVNEGFARAAVAAFAAQLDPTLAEIGDIKTAVSEAVTNAVVHAYPDKLGTVQVRVRILPDERLQELLDIPANRKVIEFSQISRDGEGQPVAYDVKFVPYARAYPSVESEIRYAVLPDLTFAKLSSFSVYSQITVTAVAAEGEPARALECPEGTPLLLIEQIFLQQDGSRVGVQHHYSRAPRGKLTGTSGHRQ